MKITSIAIQTRNNNRVNVAVDGKYRFSLDLFQVSEIGIKVGQDILDPQIELFESESKFGKLYGRALEYCLVRPRSVKELRDYLYRKTMSRKDKTGKILDGYSSDITARVLDRLIEKKYLDDQKFANYWVDNRLQRKGISHRKLTAELRSKGVSSEFIDQSLMSTDRNNATEIQKIISKKRHRYIDDNKFMMYLARQGFDYEDIKTALNQDDDVNQ